MEHKEIMRKAKYFATLILHCTSLAELFLKDYESVLYKAGYESKQARKMEIKSHAKQAEKLRISLKRLENSLNDTMSEEQKDAFYEDIGFLHQILTLVIDRCGDNDSKRTQVQALLYNMKSELHLLDK